MNIKAKNRKNQANGKNNSQVIVLVDIKKKADEILQDLKSFTWKELEVHGKFDKNDKLSFIREDMLIVGCDIGSETHYIRAINTRGVELSKKAFAFSNSEAGFSAAKEWMLELAALNDKTQIVLGLEPTGHYWFCLAAWFIENGISVVQVNPYAVKQTKEIEDNSQRKDDCKDPKLIANLVKDGNYGMPYLPEAVYADLRRLSMLRDQLTEDRIRYMNRMHRELKIYFPEYQDAFGKVDGAFTLELLKVASFPEDLLTLGESGIREIWHKAKLRGRGYQRAEKIIQSAKSSVGLKEGASAGKISIRMFAEKILALMNDLAEVEAELHAACLEIPYAENLLGIQGVGKNILSGILAEIGDISRFDDAKEIQKLSGMHLVACSSGKHKGETKISRRGRKRLRYWLFQAAKSAVTHAEEFKLLHLYYTTRQENPLKKMQSLIVIACKILRIIYAVLKNGTPYNPQKMLGDIKQADQQGYSAIAA